jgi:predicted  nucleic acid-binding Zn-ribbon protein
MVVKLIKFGVLTLACGLLAGTLLFGRDAGSYFRSSARSVRTAVKDNIPIEFELRRARDLLDDILPEMQANVRVIAQQEVEIDAAKGEIADEQKSLHDESARIQKLREGMASPQTSFTFGEVAYTREQLKLELARRFDRYREAESMLAAKSKLLEERQRSLVAAERQLEQMRERKAALEGQVEALAGQFRLVQTAAGSSAVEIDAGKLAQAENLVTEIRRQLRVAEHVLAREAKFTQPIAIDIVDEKDLLSRVDQHFSEAKTAAAGAGER